MIAEFPLPSSESGPWDITTGPDSDIWFAETINRIGHLHLAQADLDVTTSDAGSDPTQEGQRDVHPHGDQPQPAQTAEGVVLKPTPVALTQRRPAPRLNLYDFTPPPQRGCQERR
ncbi:hypothetical protein AB0H18_13660 [Streptomyces sp. NPDC020766]|uniref:hypothetical protein n=1 Tax=Streptomyces sp. NPDC020766 TaxID=3155011 RepID=UPI0033F58B94